MIHLFLLYPSVFLTPQRQLKLCVALSSLLRTLGQQNGFIKVLSDLLQTHCLVEVQRMWVACLLGNTSVWAHDICLRLLRSKLGEQ